MESAQRALKAPSKMIDGRMAVCNLASEGLSSSSSTPDQAQRKLYIGGLSPETTTEMLLSCFVRYGEIEEGSVTYDKETNKSRGFGFVTFKNVESANRAINDPQIVIGGRKITVKLADNYRAKASQMPTSAAPLPPHMAGGYPQMGSGVPMGYGYPPSMLPYYTGSYGSPPSAAAAPYSQMPYPYPQYPVKREGASPQSGHGGYHPYYMPKQ